MTLGTVVRDVYTNNERQTMRKTLDELLPNPDWSKAGLYCYWDPENGEALYIGLSTDLPSRFAQHNGLKGKPGHGNKALEINDWFQTRERIGFSIVLQSALADDVYERNTKIGEGQLIEGYRALHDKFPPWNKVSGSKDGHKYVGTDTATWFDLMTGKVDSLLVARRTIRELNDNDDADDYKESLIHMSRTGLNFHASNGKLDDTTILSSLKHNLDSDFYRFDDLHVYLMQPPPHPERLTTSEADDEAGTTPD